MSRVTMVRVAVLSVASLLAAAAPGSAQTACQNTGSFDRWMADFRVEAAKQGISRTTISSALDGMTLDQGILSRDRRQSFFSQTFTGVVAKLATNNRIQSGTSAIERHRTAFQRAEKDYGVPSAPIAAFWALESDFGSGMGKLPVLRSLATLAYDCRRGEMFRGELMAALRIIDRGDLKPSEMIGSWAGELGQTQFLPGHYWNYAVDYDGDGKRDLLRSPADVIGSSAAFMQSLGWQRGQPWLQEVRVPANLPWEQADISIQHPRSKWAAWGVTARDGQPFTGNDLPASLLLPMGRNGPAFLAYPNFHVFTKWNQALSYATTAAYLATRIAGAPALNKGNGPVAEFSMDDVRELQQLLHRTGLYDDEIDGKMGSGTRTGVKQAQIKFKLPADSYPTPELIELLRRQ
ncbi:lytic murein transglycosylase [Leptospira interrogans]